MGVKGLWKLISSSGLPVTLESLENKILAIDVSIWLHQAIRGFKGYGTGSVANAHLLTLFHRICKLLFYRIKPVFIFDGGVPHLKRQTLSSRRLKREVAAGKALKVRDRLLANLLKSQAVRNALGKKGPVPSQNYVSKPVKNEKDLFELPPLPHENLILESDKDASENEENILLNSIKASNLHSFELENKDFKSLALESQHEILSELQDTRKQSSWNIINTMPQESDNFSSFQMGRLLKRRKFQETLDNVRSEIRQRHCAEMEAQLFGELEKHVSLTERIISEDSAHSILIKKINDTELSEFTKPGLTGSLSHGSKLKMSSGKAIRKQDFLTQLAKHGIVKINSEDTLSSISSESSEEFSTDDDEFDVPLRKKRKLEENAFLHAIDYVLDDSNLTQEELMAIFEQSKNEVNISPEKLFCKSNQMLNLDQPSTSANAPGFIEDKSETDSSLDDDDFIDIPLIEENNVSSSSSSTPERNLCHEKIAIPENNCNFSPTKKSNLDVIRNAQSNSLYIKIMQQKLDDIVLNSTKCKKNVIDSRKQSYVETKDPDKTFPQTCNMVCPTNSVTLSLNFVEKQSIDTKDDLFADVFCKSNEKAPTSLGIPELTQSWNNHFQHSESKVKEVGDNLFPSPLKDCITNSSAHLNHDILSEKHSLVSRTEVKPNEILKTGKCMEVPDNIFNNVPGIDLSDAKVRDQISEFLELEVKKIILKSQDNLNGKGKCHAESDHNIELDATKKIQTISNRKPDDLQINESMSSNKQINDLMLITSTSTSEAGGNGMNSAISQSLNKLPTNCLNEAKLNGTFIDESSINSEFSCDNSSFENESANVDIVKNILVPESPSNLKSIEKPLSYSEKDLKTMEGNLIQEQDILIAEARNQDRVAAELSDQVYREAQELLQVFGLPYLVAPMEAEAQCAFLDKIGLTHGTVTDDSDIFLFGGKRVYKNFFNHDRHVEFFKFENIENNFGLDRDKIISLALLTGSDYTIGIESVGTVLGMEILAEFPGNGIECLRNLKKWWLSARTDSLNTTSKTKQRLLNLFLPESFPNENIFKAYNDPEVDESREKFSWLIPNAEKLGDFTAEKFGWSRSKTSEILIPVFKKMGIKETQMRLDSYFTNIKLIKDSPNKSKRLKEAIQKYKGVEICSENLSSKIKKGMVKIKAQSHLGKQKSKGILLADISEGTYGPSSLSTKSIHLGEKRTKVRKQKPSDSVKLAKNFLDGDENCSQEPFTKDEKKRLIYQKLLEKEKIMQRDIDKMEMKEKKKMAIGILAKQKKTSRKK